MNKRLLILVLIAFVYSVHGAAHNSDGTQASVQALVNRASNGDIVTLPAGTLSWTAKVSVKNKNITIQGQTTTNYQDGTANDQTKLVDNLAHVPGGQGFIEATGITGAFRITGITFTGVGGSQTTMNNGALRIFGHSNQIRVDHCHFDAVHHSPHIHVEGDTSGPCYGVIDHNVFTKMPDGCETGESFNGTAPYGDQEFTQPAGFGSPNFLFIESNYISSAPSAGGWDGQQGGKWVFRYNHLYNNDVLNHGTGNRPGRGGRAIEVYNNDYHWTQSRTMDGILSGSMIAHDNTYDGSQVYGYSLQTYRMFINFGAVWGGATGDNPWDSNSRTTFDSGTATGGNSTHLIDTSKNWTPNQWAGYTAKSLSDSQPSYIQSNTNNTLNVNYYGGHIWKSGDSYQIHKVLIAIDQPCRGAGDAVNRNSPAWPNQAIEPCYSWNNIYSPGNIHINFTPAINPPLQNGVDYFNDTPMPGYTPYTYPHPLTKGLLLPEQVRWNAPGDSQHNPHKKRRPWGGKNLERKQLKKAKASRTNEMREGEEKGDN